MTNRFLNSIFMSKKLVIVLLCVIIAGSVLRFTGTSFGLPYKLHPDEWAITDDAYLIASGKEDQPKALYRPDHTNILICSFVFKCVGYLKGESFEEEYNNDITPFYTAARCISAFFGVLSIFMSFLIAEFLKRKSGIYAASLVAFAPTLIRHSHYITPEILQTFCILCITYILLLYFKFKNTYLLIVSSFFCAMAFCEKYPSGVYLLLIYLTILLVKNRDLRKYKSKVVKDLLIVSVSFLVSIYIITPTLLTRYLEVIAEVKHENFTTFLGADGLGFFGNFLYYFKTYYDHFGIIILALSFFGGYYCIKKMKCYSIVPLYAIVYMVPLCLTNLHWERWGVPLYTNMLIIAAVGLRVLFQMLFKEYFCILGKNRLIKVIAVIPVIVAGLNMICASIDTTMGFSAIDTQVYAVSVISKLGITQNNACYEGYTPLSPGRPQTIFKHFKKLDFNQPKNKNHKYAIFSSGIFARFYREPERYKAYISFYNEAMKKNNIIHTITPVARCKKSPFGVIDFVYSLNHALQYKSGGMNGPKIVISKIPK